MKHASQCSPVLSGLTRDAASWTSTERRGQERNLVVAIKWQLLRLLLVVKSNACPESFRAFLVLFLIIALDTFQQRLPRLSLLNFLPF